MFRVVIDLTKLKQLHCGLGQYALHLGHALLRRRSELIEPTFLVRPRDARYFAEQGVELVFARPWRRETLLRPIRPLLRPFGAMATRVDVWHCTMQFARYLPLNPSVPVVLTIHDLNFLRQKRRGCHARFLRNAQRLVDRAAAVTTISHFVAQEIRHHFDLQGKELRVIYNGGTSDVTAAPQRPAFAPQGKFLFTIGSIMRKKNFHVLVEMMQRLPQLDLVIAGQDHDVYAEEIRRRAHEAGLAQRVHLPGPISDAHRQWLYEHCEAFVFPSLTEGFGLPVVEAMQAGRPVFCSHNTSLPEVGGDLAFYWRDYDPERMAAVFRRGMEAFARDPCYGERLRSHAAQFTWERAAREYYTLYEELLLRAPASIPQAVRGQAAVPRSTTVPVHAASLLSTQ
jgi:glycosyltransferase involved in cell wall biosynthesis